MDGLKYLVTEARAAFSDLSVATSEVSVETLALRASNWLFWDSGISEDMLASRALSFALRASNSVKSFAKYLVAAAMVILVLMLESSPVTVWDWGVPDRGVTIAILTLGKGRVPSH